VLDNIDTDIGFIPEEPGAKVYPVQNECVQNSEREIAMRCRIGISSDD
jgi:hypothetical protein